MLIETTNRVRGGRAKLLIALLMAVGCGSVGGACGKKDEIQPEPAATGGSGGSSNTGGATATGGGATTDAGDIELACPAGLQGPALVRIKTSSGVVYCMDQREVSWGEYKAFLAAKAASTSAQPADCSWNTSFEPEYQDPPNEWGEGSDELYKCEAGSQPTSDNVAAGCVDFCDALAYCEWVGKRLCGRVGGSSKPGPIDALAADAGIPDKEALSDLAKTTAIEFGYACTQGGQTTYPYGNTYEAARCIDSQWVAQKGESSLQVVDLSNRTCHGTVSPFDQLYDLSGSVQEWQNLCWLSLGGMSCLSIGGSSAEAHQTKLACAADVGFGSVRHKSSYTGFRCCADGVPL